MKQIAVIYILPFLISLISICFIATNSHINEYLFQKGSAEIKEPLPAYIENFRNNSYYENQFLRSADSKEVIFLLGSSELSSATVAIPYNFIPRHFSTELKAVGHAGNQCLSIYAQLLANEERLENAPVVIILSPGWFESKPSKGTSSAIFLEFNSERFLKKVIKNEDHSEFRKYLYKRVSEFYNEFNSPNLELKLMNFSYLSSRSFIHDAICSPLIFSEKLLFKMKEEISPKEIVDSIPFKRVPIAPTQVFINWDSLYTSSKEEVSEKSTNNNMGIADDYYTANIHGKIGHMEPVNKKFNQELEDCIMLIKLLKEKKVNASFIISPLNALYYKNLKDIIPTIDIVENEIKKAGFRYLNLLEPDTSKYEKPILHDVMHMSDYGWYKVDHFIVETYHLSK